MISAVELVLTSSGGVLSHLATFVLIEIDTLNRAGRASTDLAFRQIAASYARSTSIRPFMPRIDMPARAVVEATIRAILPPARTVFGSNKPTHLYRELNPNYLKSILSERKKAQKMPLQLGNWLNERYMGPI